MLEVGELLNIAAHKAMLLRDYLSIYNIRNSIIREAV